jgi:hypothetical protein
VIVGGIGSTVVDADALLLPGVGSGIVLAIVAVFEITVPCNVPALTLTTTTRTAVSPMPNEAFEKTTFPVPPTAGALIDHPLPLITAADTNVVLAGVASVTVVLMPGPGPLLTIFNE